MTPQVLNIIASAFKDVDITDKKFDLMTLFKGLHPDERVKPVILWATGLAQAKNIAGFEDRLDFAYKRWLAGELLGGWPESVVDLIDLFMDHHAIKVGFDGTMSSTKRNGCGIDFSGSFIAVLK